MYILIAADGELSLHEGDNFKAFSIREAVYDSATTHLAGIATPAEERHFWLDADAVIALSGRQEDAPWIGQFWEMLTKVEAYGYADLANKRVKAHVEQA